jgi:hypothetical protein
MNPEAMPAVNDLGEIMQGAEQAAGRGDHAGAERLLRQALALQETTVGAQHPDVARTLNNLAIVCEMNGKLDDAEACYRRAYAIAIARLPLGDPFITTSRENLEEFCQARGIPLKQASPAPFRSEAQPSRAASPRATSAVPSTPRTATAVAVTREPSRGPAIALGLAALVVVIVLGWFLVETNPDQARIPSAAAAVPSSSAASAPTPAPAVPAPFPASAAPTPASEAAPPATPPREADPVAPTPTPVAAAEPPAATTRRSSISIVSAELCRGLTRSVEWTCTPAGAEPAPGTFYFYTRVAAPTDTLIEHRWYRGDRLHQRVPLRIAPNPNGFRTYSQTTITAAGAGIWKVEVRTPDGEVLDERTVAVR